LKEAGKTDKYIEMNSARFVSRHLANFDFENKELCSEFVRGTGKSTQTKIKFTPKGYLYVIVALTDRLLGKEFRQKYINFMLNATLFTAKLDLFHKVQTNMLKEQLGRITQTLAETNQTLAETDQTLAETNQTLAETTNRTNQSFWGHMHNLCKSNGFESPRFGLTYNLWNHNATLLGQLRQNGTHLRHIRRVQNNRHKPWIYTNQAGKDWTNQQFANLDLH